MEESLIIIRCKSHRGIIRMLGYKSSGEVSEIIIQGARVLATPMLVDHLDEDDNDDNDVDPGAIHGV